MKTADILKSQDFEQVTQVKLDPKNRICLGDAAKLTEEKTVNLYIIYRNSKGQIILDPQVTIPASEAWIYENKTVFKAIQQGLNAAKKGKVKKTKEDYSKYITDEE